MSFWEVFVSVLAALAALSLTVSLLSMAFFAVKSLVYDEWDQ